MVYSEKALSPCRWAIRRTQQSGEPEHKACRFSQGKPVWPRKTGESPPTSTPSDRPGRRKLLVDHHGQCWQRLVRAPWRGACRPASAPQHAHTVRCLAHDAVRPPAPRSPAAASLAAMAACVCTPMPHTRAHQSPPTDRSPTLLRSSPTLFQKMDRSCWAGCRDGDRPLRARAAWLRGVVERG